MPGDLEKAFGLDGLDADAQADKIDEISGLRPYVITPEEHEERAPSRPSNGSKKNQK